MVSEDQHHWSVFQYLIIIIVTVTAIMPCNNVVVSLILIRKRFSDTMYILKRDLS